MRANFAVRPFELDPTYQVMRLLNALGIIALRPCDSAELVRAT
jgi:hypothetical protein